MLRALIIFLLVLGVVAGGLLMLRRTAGTPPKNYKPRPPAGDDEDRTGW